MPGGIGEKGLEGTTEARFILLSECLALSIKELGKNLII